jgi:hypothetical protein
LREVPTQESPAGADTGYELIMAGALSRIIVQKDLMEEDNRARELCFIVIIVGCLVAAAWANL